MPSRLHALEAAKKSHRQSFGHTVPSFAGMTGRGLRNFLTCSFAGALAILAATIITAAGARADEDRAAWFKSLKMPGSPVPCCDVSDCHRTDAEWRDGQWWAVVRGILMPIPRDRELNRKSIDGDAYVCASTAADRMIFCFIRPDMPM